MGVISPSRVITDMSDQPEVKEGEIAKDFPAKLPEAFARQRRLARVLQKMTLEKDDLSLD